MDSLRFKEDLDAKVMGNQAIKAACLALLALLAPACQWYRHDGPSPETVAACRRMSQQGVAAAERGRVAEATRLLTRAVETCPTDAEARRYLGENLWENGSLQAAIVQMEEACRLLDDDPTLRARLAQMYLAKGSASRARRNAELALDMNPKLAAAWAVRGRINRADRRFDEALADCHRAIGYAPDDRRVLLEIAELYRQLNQPQRALSTLHSLAATYAPGQEPQEVLQLTGLAYMALDRHEEAVEYLSSATIRDDPTPELLYRLGQAELLAGRPHEAAGAAQQALQLDPRHVASRKLLDRALMAQQTEPPLRR